jgi:hypothetical protein
MLRFNPREIDWCFVLNLKEFSSYLSLSDAVEISQLNKLCRQKQKPKLFNILKYGLRNEDLTKFNRDLVKGKLDLESIVNEFINEEPKDISQYFVELAIHNYFNIYKLLPIADIFNNLNSISIFNIFIPLKVVVTSCERLKLLKVLKLEKVTLVQFQTDLNTGPLLKLPSEFNSLVLSDCYLIKSELTEDPLRLAYNYDNEAISKNQLYMLDQKFPKLESFTIIGSKSTVTPALIDFLSDHPLITNLKLSSNLLTQNALNFISEIPNITSLNIEDRGIDPSLIIPTFPHIQNFKLYFHSSQFNWKGYEFCTKLTNLKSLTMNYFRNFAEILSEILQNSPTLKILKIYNNLQGELELEYITLNSINHLELHNFRQRSLNSQIFINSPNLKKLTIHKTNDKYSLTGIGYHCENNNDKVQRLNVFNFKDYSDYFEIYPITNFNPELIKFDKLRLNLYYLEDFTNY